MNLRSFFRPFATLTALALLASSFALSVRAADAPVIPLWSGTAPGSEGKTGDEQVRLSPGGEHIVSQIHRPTLTVFLPSRSSATGAGVVICPGGGHRELWMDHEGHRVARWFADHGIAAFILKYRLAREEGSTYRVDVESLADAQRALRTVRAYAVDWRLDPRRIGIIGFSAGGELAALAATRIIEGDPTSLDPLEKASSRPAFQALIYPGNAKTIAPAPTSPPAFLLCGYADDPRISEELARVYLRFKAVNVPAELHIFSGTGHGFGLREGDRTPAGAWPERFRDWLGELGFLRPTPTPKAP